MSSLRPGRQVDRTAQVFAVSNNEFFKTLPKLVCLSVCIHLALDQGRRSTLLPPSSLLPAVCLGREHLKTAFSLSQEAAANELYINPGIVLKWKGGPTLRWMVL